MSDPRYPGVTDAGGAEGGYDNRESGRRSDSRGSSSYGDSYGTPAGEGGSRAASGHSGYPSGSQPAYGGRSQSRSESPGRSYGGGEYGESGQGYSGGGSGAPSSGSGYPAGGYSTPTTYGSSGRKTTYDTTGQRTTYDTSGGGRSSSTYDTRSGSRQGGGAVQSGAARAASALRRSVSSAARGPRGPRRARLQLKHIDPWSTLKFSLVLAVALFVVWMVAIGVLYGVLDGMGVFDKLNGLYQDVTGKDGAHIVGPGLVLGIAALVGAINIVLFTALATVGSFIYNMCADLVGGVEITLSEHD